VITETPKGALYSKLGTKGKMIMLMMNTGVTLQGCN
jgi:hypothetical protein